MNFQAFSSIAQYVFVMRSLKESTEGRRPLPYIDDPVVGHPTIGIGYDLTDATTRARVLQELGLSPTGATAQQYAALEAVFTQNWQGQTNQALQNAANAAYGGVFSLTDPQIDAIFADFNVRFENVVTNWATANNLGTIPPSYERAVLLSLAYNMGTPGPRLAAAIRNNDRAEAWFEIRYASNEGKQSRGVGIAKRRFMESELFGLSDNPASVSADEAKSVYRMLQLHRGKILLEESLWGLTPDGVRGSSQDIIGRTGLEAANQDYANLLQFLSDGIVDSLTSNLTPVRDAIIAWVNTQLPAGAVPITASMIDNSAAIYLDPGRDNVSQQIDPNHRGVLIATRYDASGSEIVERALLIGEGGDDYLMVAWARTGT
jgi:GH24 family phage-related lysozyme (muramidase)